MTDKKKMHIGWFSGHGLGPDQQTWADDRRPEGLRFDRPDEYIEMARVLERAGVDFMLFADNLGIPDNYKGSIAPYIENAVSQPRMDLTVLAPILTAATSSIGFIATLSTLYYPPHLLARLMSSLDHVTAGRIGWNIVTGLSARAAQNFGQTSAPPHDLRYDIGDEYVAAARHLWGSWAEDSVIEDVASGVFADPRKVDSGLFSGDYYTVRAPLNIARSPQGRPFLAQAGQSDRGIRFAGTHADACMANCRTVEEMKDYRERVRSAAKQAGRDPDSVKVFFIIAPRIAETHEGLDIEHFPHADAALAMGLAHMSFALVTDLSKLPLDEPVVLRDEDVAPGIDINRVRAALGGGLTLREFAMRYTNQELSLPVRGTATEIADQLEEVFDEVGGDGFMIRGQWIPEYVNDVAVDMLGQLRRRGRIAPPQPGVTLRDRMRLDASVSV